MLKVKINKDKIIEYKQEKGQIIINDQPFPIDILPLGNNHFHLLRNSVSYNAELVKFDSALKTLSLKIEGKMYDIEVKDRFDLLLEKMGINPTEGIKAENVKAPMPGLLIDIKVIEGQEVEFGEALMILEAMKMENILKSPRKGVVKNIKVKKGESVEKNQILIEF